VVGKGVNTHVVGKGVNTHVVGKGVNTHVVGKGVNTHVTNTKGVAAVGLNWHREGGSSTIMARPPFV
jgi:hypothetical protein